MKKYQDIDEMFDEKKMKNFDIGEMLEAILADETTEKTAQNYEKYEKFFQNITYIEHDILLLQAFLGDTTNRPFTPNKIGKVLAKCKFQICPAANFLFATSSSFLLKDLINLLKKEHYRAKQILIEFLTDDDNYDDDTPFCN